MFAIVFHLVHVLMFVSFVNSYLFTQKPKINQYNKIPFSAIPLFATNTNQENTPLNYQQYGKHSISKLITKSVTSVVAVTSLLSIPSASYAVLVADAAPSRYPIIGRDDIMRSKTHGTSDSAVQSKLRWNCDVSLADRICNYNRNWAEMAGYWLTTSFIKDVDGNSEVTFYDSVTGLPLFIAPKGRSFQDWVAESTVHGWPSFRDNEVVWENVRALRNGETVSLTGTHLGHNLPDRSGNRYCINLVSIAGLPSTSPSVAESQ